MVFQRSFSGRFCALLPFHDGGSSSSTHAWLVDFLGPSTDGVGGEVTIGNPGVLPVLVRRSFDGSAHLLPPLSDTRRSARLRSLPSNDAQVRGASLPHASRVWCEWVSSDASLVSVASLPHVSGSIGAPRRAIGTPSTRSAGHN